MDACSFNVSLLSERHPAHSLEMALFRASSDTRDGSFELEFHRCEKK